MDTEQGTRKMRVNQAIATALTERMRADPSVIVLGEDVADAGGPFKTSDGLLAEFGAARVRDTPISEMGFVGAAVGAALMGMRPVVEIMFMEFLGVALDQLVTEAAKFHFMSNGRLTVPMTVRCSVGSGLGFGLQHSQTLENWLTATCGLKTVVVSDAQSAYTLTHAAVRDPDPVVVLEPRALYGERGSVALGSGDSALVGRARVLSEGDDVTVAALGQTVQVALDAAERADGSVEVIDLSTLVPWDHATVLDSVRRTGRLVLLEESPASGGWGHEIVSVVVTNAFGSLKAPPWRCSFPDVPIPYNKSLETSMMPRADVFAEQLGRYLETSEIPDPWWHEAGVR